MGQAQLQGRAAVDSLFKDLIKSKEDTHRVSLLVEISRAYHILNPDTGMQYGTKALTLAEDLQWKFGIARAHNALGLNYEAHTDNSSALSSYVKALNLFEELKGENKITLANADIENKIAVTNGNIGNIYQSLGRYPDALDYYFKALRYFRKHNDKDNGLARNLGNVAIVYELLKIDSNALIYYDSAIKLSDKEEDIAKNQGNIAGIYYNRNNFVRAIELANEALAIYEKLGDKKSIAINYCNIGDFYVAMVKYAGETGKMQMSNKQDNLNRAISYLNKCIDVSKEIGYKEGLGEAYDGLKDTYQLLGDYKTALDYFLKYSNIKDSINSAENKKNIAKTDAEIGKERQKAALAIVELQNQKDRIKYIVGIILLLIAIGVVVKYFISELQSNRKLAMERKKHIERIRVQKTVLKDIAYIQSHEVRGPVSTILGLTQLFNYEDLADPTNRELMEGITTVAGRLDKIVTEVVSKENKIHNDADTESDKEDNI